MKGWGFNVPSKGSRADERNEASGLAVALFSRAGRRAVGSGCKLLAFTSMVSREIFPATNWSARGQMILDIYQINEISRVTRFKQPKKSRI